MFGSHTQVPFLSLHLFFTTFYVSNFDCIFSLPPPPLTSVQGFFHHLFPETRNEKGQERSRQYFLQNIYLSPSLSLSLSLSVPFLFTIYILSWLLICFSRHHFFPSQSLSILSDHGMCFVVKMRGKSELKERMNSSSCVTNSHLSLSFLSPSF